MLAKTVTLIIVSFSFIVSYANPIDVQAAKDVARNFFSEKWNLNDTPELVSNASEAKGTFNKNNSEAEPYYMFRPSSGKGYVIVSGEDMLPGVIAYSDTQAVDAEDMPVQMKALLGNLSEYVEAVREGSISPIDREQIKRSVSYDVVGPFVTSIWHQNSPYNNMCPKVSGVSCDVGCVAISMAQMVRYYGYPENPTGKITWNTENRRLGTMTVDFSSYSLDYSLMLDDVTAYSNTEIINQVATLSFLCGAAAQMQYSTSGSAAYDENALVGLRDYFGYSPAELRLQYRECFATQAEWNQLIYDELMNNGPLIMGAASDVGSTKDAAGHSFIIDGIDSDGFVHVNWGWGGSYDNYFDISLMTLPMYEFSKDQCVILGIHPAGIGEVRRQDRLINHDYYIDCKEDETSFSRSSSFKISVGRHANYSLYAHTFTLGVGLYDKEGNFVCEIATDSYSSRTLEFEPDAYLDGKAALNCKIPTSVEPGDYTMRVVSMEDGYTDWVEPDVVGGSALNRLPVLVEKNVVRIGEVSSGINDLKINNNVEITTTRYYDFNGILVPNPVKNQKYIRVDTYSDGNVRSRKVIF
jgi:hypothetical protein